MTRYWIPYDESLTRDIVEAITGVRPILMTPRGFIDPTTKTQAAVVSIDGFNVRYSDRPNGCIVVASRAQKAVVKTRLIRDIGAAITVPSPGDFINPESRFVNWDAYELALADTERKVEQWRKTSKRKQAMT